MAEGNGITMEKLTIQIESTSKNATQAVGKLISSLEHLNKSLEKVVNTSGRFSELKKNISAVGVGKMQSMQTSAKGKSAPFAKYGSKESQMAALNIDTKSIGKQISDVTNATALGTTQTTKYKNALGQTTTVIRKVDGELEGFKVTLQNANKETSKGTSVFSAFTKGITGTIAKVEILWHSISNTAKGMGEFLVNATTYYEALNLFTVTLGDRAQEATEWVEKFSTSLYLDPAQVMQYMGTFNSLVKGLGVGADNAYLMSQNMTQLVYDLASFKNIGFEEAFRKLQSGISGKIICLVRKGLRAVTYLIQWKSKRIMA